MISAQNIDDIKLSSLHISGLTVTGSPSVITISPGFCRDSTNSYTLSIPNVLSINPNKIGINGVDTANVPFSSQEFVLYSVYVIGDASGFNPVASIMTPTAFANSSGNPLMPSGYNIKRLVGYAILNTTFFPEPNAFSNSLTIGTGSYRKFFLNETYFTILLGTTAINSDSINLNYLVPYVDQTPIYAYLAFAGPLGTTCNVGGYTYYSQSNANQLTLNIEASASLTSGNMVLSYGAGGTGNSLSLYMQGFDYIV